MSGKSYTVDLPAPDTAALELPLLVAALDSPPCRDLLGRLLADKREEQGLLEHCCAEFTSPETANIAAELQKLRRAGWVQQRPGPDGLLTRLRCDDVDLRFAGLLDHLRPQLVTDYVKPAVSQSPTLRRRIDAELRKILHPH